MTPADYVSLVRAIRHVVPPIQAGIKSNDDSTEFVIADREFAFGGAVCQPLSKKIH